MKCLFISFFLSLFFYSCTTKKDANPHVIITTNFGEIDIELYQDKAPKTVTSFLQFVQAGVYNNSSFYRVILEESVAVEANTGIIQGGTWPSKNEQHSVVHTIEHESTKETGLSHTTGTISLARTTAGTASTEFFICIGNQTHFDFGSTTPPDGLGMAAFGRVVKGMPIVRQIQMQPNSNNLFNEKIIITSISIQ